MATASESTQRSVAKATRRQALLTSAASLFAQRGFSGVSIEELGAAAGVSGPAVYRHFETKRAVLADLLIEVSEELLAGAQVAVDGDGPAHRVVETLIDFHLDFALSNADVIRVQDRDLASLDPADRDKVRTLQRTYVRIWETSLSRLQPHATTNQLKVVSHALFGLLNSTPYSLGHGRSSASVAVARASLKDMALAAVGISDPAASRTSVRPSA